jgi:uncharacterized protein (TIGR02145 family)
MTSQKLFLLFQLVVAFSFHAQINTPIEWQNKFYIDNFKPIEDFKIDIPNTYIVPRLKTCSQITVFKNAVCLAAISSLDPKNAILSKEIKSDELISGVTISLPYTGGNGGVYKSQELFSTEVTGLIANLPAGSVQKGNGNLVFTLSGIAKNGGKAKFNLNLGGQQCVFEINVVATKTPTSGYGPNLTDVEGNTYKTIYVGPQQWMAENLKTSLYQDGSSSPQVRLGFNWATTTSAAWCYLFDQSSNNTNFGKLYNYYAITNVSPVCPSGWHIPSSFEFELLANSLGGSSVAGGALKNITDWQTPNVSATNSSLFSAFPGERRIDDGTFSSSGGSEKNEAYFWSSTLDPKYATNAFQYTLNSNTAKIAQVSASHQYAASVRCVKGSQPMTSSIFPVQNVFTTSLEQPIRKDQAFSNLKCIVSYTNGVKGILHATGLNGIVQDITFSSQGITGKISPQEIVDGAGQFIVYLSGSTTAEGNVDVYFKNGTSMVTLTIKVLHATSGDGPTIYDASGNSYPTVNIGSQQWMAKNLKTDKYTDGTIISNVDNQSDWINARTGSWSNFENNTTNGTNYGKLYNAYAVQTQKLCPSGWHIPSKIEWDTLFNYLGGIKVAGSKLKAVSSLYQAGENTDATNSSKFSGLAGGMRNVDGAFYNLARIGYYWSSTQIGSLSIYNTSFKTFYVYYLHAQQAAVIEDTAPEIRGFSVRCLKDE